MDKRGYLPKKSCYMVIISLLSLACHQAHGQKGIFAKEIVFLGDYLAFVSVCHQAHGQKEIFTKEILLYCNYLAFDFSMSSGTWTKGDIYQRNRVPR